MSAARAARWSSWPAGIASGVGSAAWLIALGAFFVFPDRMTFGSQVLVMVLFALSLDLILGYTGIVTARPCGVLRPRRLYGGARRRQTRLE